MIKIKVIGNHHSAFAGGDRFDIIKAESSHIAETAQFFAFDAGAASLSVIFQNQQFVSMGDFHDFIDIGA